MRYSSFAGGKRLRPILCLASAEACGGTYEAALAPAASVECIHTYSLIHDDLPCMDDDDLRRGMPTSHVKFGEGVAVLAGDALLTIAFEILAQVTATKRYDIGAFITELAVIGQPPPHWRSGHDLEGEGSEVVLTAKQLKYIHESKTAALLTASIRLGGMTANATPAQLEALSVYGSPSGLPFRSSMTSSTSPRPAKSSARAPARTKPPQSRPTPPSSDSRKAGRKQPD
jgi:geranylgeranyl diphosphate synthase type II